MNDIPVGKHLILELYGCSPALLNDESFIRNAVTEASVRAKSTLLKYSSHQFEPQGVTAIGLLAESHLSIHTWPETGYAAVDVFTCGTCLPEAACAYMVEQFKATHYMLKEQARGGEPINAIPAESLLKNKMSVEAGVLLCPVNP